MSAPRRFGAIILARHGEPALSRRVKLNAEGYRDWWARYEVGGLLGGQTPPASLAALAADAQMVSSTLRRSQETAKAVAGDRPVHVEPLMVEAPLPPPPWPSWLKFSPRTWGVISRISWWIGGHQGQESRQQAERRAAAAAARLAGMASGGQDVLVLAHGYFNAMVGAELRRIGWRCARDEGFRYWSQRRFEKI